MQVSSIYLLLAQLGGMIVLGAIIPRFMTLGESLRQGMVFLILQIAMPALILDSLFTLSMDDQLILDLLTVFALSVGINCFGIAAGRLLGLFVAGGPSKQREMAVLAGLGNTAFLGIPLCYALFGAKGALLAAVFDAGVDVVIWSVGVAMLRKGNRSFKNYSRLSFFNMPILAVAIGFTLSLVDLHPPVFVKEAIHTLSGMTVPLGMLYIGMVASTVKSRSILLQMKRALYPITVKLVLVPVAALSFLLLLNLDTELQFVVLIQASMPVMTLSTVLFAHCRADEEFAAISMISSTVLALLTVPFFASLAFRLFG